MKRMPAAGNMSSASMNAEPTMPNTSRTRGAASVSTRASEGLMRCLVVVILALRRGWESGILLVESAAAVAVDYFMPKAQLAAAAATSEAGEGLRRTLQRRHMQMIALG